jgi:dipeptidase D
MDGAMALEPGFFTGKTLINLDSEDEGQLFVGCAGGVNTIATFTYKPENIPSGYKGLLLKIFGAQGGHSGDDINKDRCNTVQQLARFLYAKEGEYRLVSFNGGGKFNAIAREAEAFVAVPADKADDFAARFSFFGHTLSSEYHKTDPGVKVEVVEKPLPEKAIDRKTAEGLVMSLVSVHHGVLTMSQDIPDLVETSNNLASVRMMRQGEIEIVTSQRSSVTSQRKMIASKVEANFIQAGAEVEHVSEYPGWKPNLDSKILQVCVDSYRKLFGCDPEVKAIHAGLECGLFGEKFGDLDMISFGPTLRGVHAPGEKLDLASLDKFTDHLIDVVTSFR